MFLHACLFEYLEKVKCRNTSFLLGPSTTILLGPSATILLGPSTTILLGPSTIVDSSFVYMRGVPAQIRRYIVRACIVRQDCTLNLSPLSISSDPALNLDMSTVVNGGQ